MASSKISQKSGNLVFLIPATHVQALWDTFFTVTNTRLSDWIKIIQLKPMTKVDHLPVNLLRDGKRSVWEDWIVFSCEKGERVDDERLAKSEDLEIFGSLDGHLFELFCKIQLLLYNTLHNKL